MLFRSAYLERVQQPFEITASLSDSENSRDMRELLQTIAGLRSDKITLKTDGQDARKPSFDLKRVGSDTSLGCTDPHAFPPWGCDCRRAG